MPLTRRSAGLTEQQKLVPAPEGSTCHSCWQSAHASQGDVEVWRCTECQKHADAHTLAEMKPERCERPWKMVWSTHAEERRRVQNRKARRYLGFSDVDNGDSSEPSRCCESVAEVQKHPSSYEHRSKRRRFESASDAMPEGTPSQPCVAGKCVIVSDVLDRICDNVRSLSPSVSKNLETGILMGLGAEGRLPMGVQNSGEEMNTASILNRVDYSINAMLLHIL